MDPNTLIIFTGIIFYLATCFALLDIGRKNFGSLYKKTLWCCIALIPFAGCLTYFIFGYKKGKKTNQVNR